VDLSGPIGRIRQGDKRRAKRMFERSRGLDDFACVNTRRPLPEKFELTIG
jgi:hypothetical protein